MQARVRFWLLVLVSWGSAGWQRRIKMRVSGMCGITISTSINPPALGPLNADD